MTEGMLNTLLVTVVPRTVAIMMRLWFLTCKVRHHNVENFALAGDNSKPLIASFWHYSFFYLFYHVRKYQATVMVSASRDGDYVDKLAKSLGFSTVRGSSNNNGIAALKKMLRAVGEGNNAAIVADGSQGPEKIAQPGAILLASRTDAPVIPIIWSASRYFTVKSWDRTAVPKLFSQVDVFYGEPIYVPPRLRPEEMEEYRIRLEESLNALYVEAWGMYGKEQH